MAQKFMDIQKAVASQVVSDLYPSPDKGVSWQLTQDNMADWWQSPQADGQSSI